MRFTPTSVKFDKNRLAAASSSVLASIGAYQEAIAAGAAHSMRIVTLKRNAQIFFILSASFIVWLLDGNPASLVPCPNFLAD